MQAAATHLRKVPDPPKELENLFNEHHEQVFRTAYRITGSVVDAEDVLQTIFLRIVRRDEGVDFSPSPGSYLHRAAVNAALDLVRSRGRSKAVSLAEVDYDMIASPGPSPAAQHESSELRNTVRQAVAALGPKAAEMCALRYFEGFNNREIAEMLGTSHMVVAVVLHRARTRLRKEVGKFLEENHEAL